MITFFKRRAEYKAYRKTVDDSLRVMFSDFPSGTLTTLKREYAVDRATYGMFKNGDTPPKFCGVMIACKLARIYFGNLSQKEKDYAMRGIQAQDLSNRHYYVSCSMDYYVAQLADETHRNLLAWHIVGGLRGYSDDEIQNRWGKGEVDRIAEAIRGPRPS